MRNEVIFDNRGIPDIMVVFTPDELGLPAEIRGKAVKEYAISKYPNTLIGGVPYSMPYQRPAVNINHDEAIRLCEAKGPGWHLLTNDEWAALAHQSRKNGTLPRGNTDCGKSHSHPEETGTTYKDDSGSSKTLTGSGPLTWNHDHTAEGVADMCGNIWEHVGGIRFMDGQVQVIPDNGAAAGADQSRDSKEWKAIHTADGDPVYYKVEDGEISLQPVAPSDTDYDGVEFRALDASALDVPEKLIELGLYPAPGYDGTDYFWLDTNGERIVIRGGDWNHGANAGVFYFDGNHSRANVYWNVGFRSALVRYSGGSGNLDDLDTEATDLSDAPQEVKDEIKANAEKLEDMDDEKMHKEEQQMLSGLVRLVLAHQLTELYKAAGGEDPDGFSRKAYEADDKEIQKAAALALPPLLQTLTEHQLEVLTMKANGYNRSQIGNALGISARAADSTLARGRYKVRQAEARLRILEAVT